MKINIFKQIDDFDWWDNVSPIVEKILRTPADEKITVYINSPGGSVFGGYAIANALKLHKGETETVVLGQAASIAGSIFLAGKERSVMKNSRVMFHRSWALIAANAIEMREIADYFDDIDQLEIKELQEITGLSEKEINVKFEKDWFITGGDNIKALGVATKILDDKEIKDKEHQDQIVSDSETLEKEKIDYKKTLEKYSNHFNKYKKYFAKALKNQYTINKKSNCEDSKKMDVEKLKKEFAEKLAEEKSKSEKALKAERERISNLLKVSRANVKKEALEAIESGTDAKDYVFNLALEGKSPALEETKKNEKRQSSKPDNTKELSGLETDLDVDLESSEYESNMKKAQNIADEVMKRFKRKK